MTADDVVTEKRAYTYEQAKRVIEFAKKHRYGADIAILLKAGVRRAELLALGWDNIDFKENVIHVTESVSEAANILEYNPCKTKKSIRDIPFDDELAVIIKSIKRITKFKTKKITVMHTHLMTDRYGKALVPHNWSFRHYGEFMKDFEKYCKEKKLDIPALLPHELRHSFGSILYSQGVDILTISKLMGHTSVEITAKLYVNDDMSLKKQAIAKGVKGNG